ncbi:CCR4-Not complex component, Not1-domain-containing protein, partial [Chytriomyces sp. MP71]
ECYVLLLERIFELSKRAAKEVISWFLFSKDERRLSIPVLVIMIRANMLPIIDLDIQLARMIDTGQPGMVELVVTLIREVLLGETPFVAYDAFFNCTMMLSERAEEDESAISLLSDIKSRYSITSLKKAGKDLESDELRESLGILFSEWVKLYHHPSSSEKTHKAFVVRLQDLGVLHDEDISSMFFRVCTELSVDLYIQAKSTPNVSPYTPFQAADAFSRLIVLLVRYCVEPDGAPGNSAKLDLTTKILYIIVLVLVHSHEQGRSQFNQRPFFRLFSSLLYDLNLFEDQLSNVYYQILFKISNTLHTLQPSFLPGFTLSWLQLISHRYFMAKLLAAESQKGWPFFQRLLVDLFKFLGPFLRQTEMADAIRLLYKATLRILLVLLHDFPEFLCDYHFSFVEVIPHSCIQLRNLILSAF